MGNTPEIKSLDDFQSALEEKGLAAKEKLVQLKEAAEEQKLAVLQNFMADFVISKGADGYVIMKNKFDQSEFRIASEQALNEIFHDSLNGTNELKINESLHEVKIETITKTTQQNAADLHKEVSDALNFPTFGNLTLLQQAYASHPEYADEHMTTREEKKLRRKTERLENARSDRARRRISGKIDKTAEKIADRRADTNKHMANAAENYVFAEELEHQSWYYNDVIHALTESKESNRVHYMDEFVYIDTYHPLFANTANFKGTIRLSRASVASYEFTKEYRKGNGEVLTAEEIQWRIDHPEDRAAIDKGGLPGAMSNWLLEHTNMTPNQAQNFQSAAKLGTLIGLGVLSWMTIKRVFNIGGKYSSGERRGWGMGAAAILVGVPALTGKGVWDLLTTGDLKDSWNKVKGLLDKNGINIENPFASTDRKVIYPALGNRMFGSMTLEDYSRYVTKNTEGNYVLNENGMRKYLNKNLELAANDPVKLQRAQEQIAIFEEAVKQKRIQIITQSHAEAMQLDKITDKSQRCEDIYKAYIDGQTLAAEILGSDKKLKVKDQQALEDYLHDQIVHKHKDTANITKEDLLKAGLLVEVTQSGNNTADDGVDDTDPVAAEKSNREEFKEWSKPKWDAFKRAVTNAKNDTIALMTGLFSGEAFRRSEPEDLKVYRDKIESLKKALREAEGQGAVTSAAEVELVRTELNDAEQMLQKIEAMSKEVIDEDIKSINIPQEVKENLTNAKKKINFELKFQSEGDDVDLIAAGNRIYVQSCGERTHIRYDNGKYYLDNMTVPFENADNILQIANLTNFVKTNFQNRSSANVSKPWKYDNGDLQFEKSTARDALKSGDILGIVIDTAVVDGEDFFKSTIKQSGGTIFQSRILDYVNYLNAQRNTRNESLWVKKEVSEQLPDDVEKQRQLFESNIVYARSAKVYDKTLQQYYGGSKHERIEVAESSNPGTEYYDKTAAIEVHGNVVFLRSYDRLIPIYPSKTRKDRWNIGAPGLAQEGDTMKEKVLPIDLNVQDAIRTANLTNYLFRNFKGLGSSSSPFELDGANLDFDDNSFTDARVIHAGKAEEYSKEFNNAGQLSVYKDWLHDITDRQ